MIWRFVILLWWIKTKKETIKSPFFALQDGLEPTTPWLTVRCSNQLSYSGFFENPGLPLFSECKYIAFFYSCKICPVFFAKTSYLYEELIVLLDVSKNVPTDFCADFERFVVPGPIRAGIRPARVGFRHHPRNRRPGYASFRLPQRRGTPRRDRKSVV